jgi:hypothetical protein
MTPDLDTAHYSNPHVNAIGKAAQELNAFREEWLNPPELITRGPELVAGIPGRILAIPGQEGVLRKRTLTNLYNARPAWLANAHRSLDMAVAQAYGWTDYAEPMPDEEILRRLLELNQQRKSL